MRKKTQRPSVINMSYKAAWNILREYTENDTYLRSLIENHTPNPELVLSCSDHLNLRHYGKTIKGVAEKMLKSHPTGRNIGNLTKTTDPVERELLEERICIQLEGCNVPDSNWVSNFYSWAKNIHSN